MYAIKIQEALFARKEYADKTGAQGGTGGLSDGWRKGVNEAEQI
jgi:hypothetical protein